jgi:hypothetical protein
MKNLAKKLVLGVKFSNKILLKIDNNRCKKKKWINKIKNNGKYTRK